MKRGLASLGLDWRRPRLRTRTATLAAAFLGFALLTTTAMAIDPTPLWDFSRPDVSEQRFRAALQSASGDDALILRTQIARTHGLRKDFDAARRVLQDVAAALPAAGPQAQVRYHLELGRTYASATHPEAGVGDEARAQARQSYGRALDLARAARLDDLTIDAIHMLAFVDTAPADQLKWGQAALEVALSSQQPAARRWEASIRNNVGYALHQLGRYDEALDQFRQALALRERGTNPQATHVARWMVAWTLRSLSRTGEALQMQLALEKDADAAGKPDAHVFEELEALYRGQGDLVKAQHYAQRKAAARQP
jgi:tetratricopeptide (TPR) repeat protein